MNYRLSTKFPARRAWITGGASGLGKQLCLELAKDGWTIGFCDINADALQQTAEQIRAAGGKALPFVLDITDHLRYAEVIAQFLSQTEQNGLDVIINNAGVGDGCPFEEYSVENWQWIVGINQMGAIYGSRLCVPIFKRQQSGHIINIASAAAFINPPGMSAYNVTKAAVLSLSETLRIELAREGIGVSVVMPTFFKTNIMQHARGPEEGRVVAAKLMEMSGISANDVAQYVLKNAGKGNFRIILPFQARFLHIVKRLFPTLFYWLLNRLAAQRESLVQP